MRFYTTAAAIIISLAVVLFSRGICPAATPPNVVTIGLNFPQTGPYADEGADQRRGADLALDQINAAGGILNHKVLLVVRDSASDVVKTTGNVNELIWNEGVKMIFGGVSSAVAIKSCDICQQNQIPFFGTLTYSTDSTGEEAHRFCFRECYDSWMAAKIIADYLQNQAKESRFFFITADYTWGWTTEKSLRWFTATMDEQRHQGVRTKLGTTNFINELKAAQAAHPDVLVLNLFGRDLISCLRQATVMGIKQHSLIVVPNLTLGMAKGAGPKAMEGVIGALPWMWQVPYTYRYSRGIDFVEAFKRRYNTYPSTSAASAYTILYEYKAAVERANSFEGPAVIRALEGHQYQAVKDPQTWRRFDHQSIQTVYLVQGKTPAEVLQDPFELDYFRILRTMPGEKAARSQSEWQEVRRKAGKSLTLEALPGE